MLKFHTFLILFITARETSYSYKKTYITRAFLKLLLNKFTTGDFKNPWPSAPKIPENLKNILRTGGWRKPNIFPITAIVS